MRVLSVVITALSLTAAAAAQERPHADVDQLTRGAHALTREASALAEDAGLEARVIGKLLAAYEELRSRNGQLSEHFRDLLKDASDLANERERVRNHFATILSTADAILLDPGASPATPGMNPIERFHHTVLDAALIHLTEDARSVDLTLRKVEQLERQVAAASQQLRNIQRNALTTAHSVATRSQRLQ